MLLLSAGASAAFAANGTWTGGGTTDNISEAANWSGFVSAQTTSGTWTFAGTTRLTPNNDLAFNSGADTAITFDNTAGAFTIGGTQLRAGGVTNNSSNLQTINLQLRYNGGRTIDTGAAGIKLNGVASSTGGGRTITKNGSGDLTLAYSGSSTNLTFSVSAGRLIATNSSGTLTIASGVSVASGTSLVSNQAGSLAVSNITGAGQVIKNSLGATTLSGTNTYSGGTIVQSGALTFGSAFTMSGANSLSLTGAATPAAGTDFGQISATTGTFTYGGDLTLSFSGTAVNNASYNLFDFVGATQAGSFNTISIGGSYTASLTNNSGIWSGSNSGMTFTFTESTGDLLVSAVPEPSTFALLGGFAALGCVGLRRRRRA